MEWKVRGFENSSLGPSLLPPVEVMVNIVRGNYEVEGILRDALMPL